MHVELASELEAVAGQEKLWGFIMDNVKVNRAAMKILEQRFPMMIFFGCQVHALNLLVKVGSRETPSNIFKLKRVVEKFDTIA